MLVGRKHNKFKNITQQKNYENTSISLLRRIVSYFLSCWPCNINIMQIYYLKFMQKYLVKFHNRPIAVGNTFAEAITEGYKNIINQNIKYKFN